MTYRYSEVVQPIVLKHVTILIIEDEAMEIIFSIISSHPYLTGTELCINMQLIDDSEPE